MGQSCKVYSICAKQHNQAHNLISKLDCAFVNTGSQHVKLPKTKT